MAKRILIADDHESALRRIRALLESEPGWEVCGEAVNGREAIAKAKELEPDLVILDFAMPRLNGLKVAAEINRFLPDVPIVMFTMYGSALRQEAQKHGMRRLIGKETPRALIEAAEELLTGVSRPSVKPPHPSI